jgi:hypothetical protein
MFRYAFIVIGLFLSSFSEKVDSNCSIKVEPNSYTKDLIKKVKVIVKNDGDGNAELIDFAVDFRTGNDVYSGKSQLYPSKGKHLTVKPGQTIAVDLDLSQLEYNNSAQKAITLAQFQQKLKSGTDFKMRSRAMDLTKLSQGMEKFFIFSNVVNLN